MRHQGVSMILGFTGTSRDMTFKQQITVTRLFFQLPITVLHHGDCEGSDATAHRLAKYVNAYIVRHPPIDHSHWANCIDADETRPEFHYLTRDRHIVRDARDGVIATPKDFIQPTNLRGQGTWTTIGYARQAHRHLWIVLPDGSVKEETP